jgi:hypothetical protein
LATAVVVEGRAVGGQVIPLIAGVVLVVRRGEGGRALGLHLDRLAQRVAQVVRLHEFDGRIGRDLLHELAGLGRAQAARGGDQVAAAGELALVVQAQRAATGAKGIGRGAGSRVGKLRLAGGRRQRLDRGGGAGVLRAAIAVDPDEAVIGGAFLHRTEVEPGIAGDVFRRGRQAEGQQQRRGQQLHLRTIHSNSL